MSITCNKPLIQWSSVHISLNTQWEKQQYFSPCSWVQGSPGAELLQVLGRLHLAEGYGLGSSLFHVSLCSPWPQSYPRDAVLTANEWQVHPSPAKSCNGFKVSSYITSTHIPLPEQGCGQAQSQWNRERHSVHAGRGVNIFSRTPDYHKVLGNSTWSLCRVLWSHKERSQHFSLVEISISEDEGIRLSLENEASIVHRMGKMRIRRGECKDRWRPL